MKESTLVEIEKYLYYPEMEPRRIYNLGLLKILAVILVFAGIAGVYLASWYAQMPVMRIKDIQGNALYNYATAYIEGIILEPPRAEAIGGKLKITTCILVLPVLLVPPTILIYTWS